jgi:hypothetical protein
LRLQAVWDPLLSRWLDGKWGGIWLSLCGIFVITLCPFVPL